MSHDELELLNKLDNMLASLRKEVETMHQDLHENENAENKKIRS